MDKLPAWACELFYADGDVVRWITREEHAAATARCGLARRDAARFRSKLIPYGRVAGGREVHGHGREVNLSGLRLVTADIRAALADGGRWPWEPGAVQRVGAASVHDAARLAGIADRVALLMGVLTWRKSPHSTIPAGSAVAGTEFTGSRRVMMLGGIGYDLADVTHALRFGDWPWCADWA